MIERRDITGVILCGGEGSRLGGRDKPLEPIHGTPLVGHVYRRLAPQVARVIASCNRNELAYAPWADDVVRDAASGRGPLSGIAAALAVVRTRYVFVCPGDAPFLSTTLVNRLAAAMTGELSAAIPHDGTRSQHLFMLLDKEALAGSLAAHVEQGGRSVHGWLDTIVHTLVDVADEAASFFNVNSWDDLDAAARIIPPATPHEAAHSR